MKHAHKARPPWNPDSDFFALCQELQDWKSNLPNWLDFTPENIYIRRGSFQLGALALVHIMYHNCICDLHKISLLELFKVPEQFVFPPEQLPFMRDLQRVCFGEAQRISELCATVLKHGAKYLSDPILPSFAYNSSKIILYYIAKILDRTSPEAPLTITVAIAHVDSNVQALWAMRLMYPIAEPLVPNSTKMCHYELV